MKRVAEIVAAGAWDSHRAIDRVVLDADERQRRRIVLAGEKGTKALLDLASPVTLRDGDGLVLDDGSIVLVAGRAEALLELTGKAPIDAVRLAWHIGNRHTDVQFVGQALRIRQDHVLEEMAKGLGAKVTHVDAPFDPEPGAPHGHAHDHE